jgi:hypothetical protein
MMSRSKGRKAFQKKSSAFQEWVCESLDCWKEGGAWGGTGDSEFTRERIRRLIEPPACWRRSFEYTVFKYSVCVRGGHVVLPHRQRWSCCVEVFAKLDAICDEISVQQSMARLQPYDILFRSHDEAEAFAADTRRKVGSLASMDPHRRRRQFTMRITWMA